MEGLPNSQQPAEEAFGLVPRPPDDRPTSGEYMSYTQRAAFNEVPISFWPEEERVWRIKAACRGMQLLFFSELKADKENAKAVCESCPVQTNCLEAALANSEQTGIWGGMDHEERKVIARQRRNLRKGIN